MGFGTKQSTPPRATPDAGTAVSQPHNAVRYDRVGFAWKGGDPQVEAPRGHVFVSLQREVAPDRWRTVDTEDSVNDTTIRSAGDVWTETYQLDRCTDTGRYRFLVTGRAVRATGAPAEDYQLASDPFTVSALRIAAPLAGNAVTPTYPDPGPALLALPRLVRGATVTFDLAGGGTVAGVEQDGTYRAPADAAVTGVHVDDGCGNAG